MRATNNSSSWCYITKMKFKQNTDITENLEGRGRLGCSCTLVHNAKNQYRKFETNIPRKGIAVAVSTFLCL
jgi:hypothetical protein